MRQRNLRTHRQLKEKLEKLLQEEQKDQEYRLAEVEIFRLVTEALKELASFSRQQYESGIDNYGNQETIRRFNATFFYPKYLQNEFGIDFSKLRSPEAKFEFFFRNVFEKRQEYKPL